MTRKPDPSNSGLPPLGADAQQVWLAGLGALTKAQQDGSKAFDTLVQEGLTLQRKVQAAAETKLNEASAKINTLTQEMSQRATGQWDKLEGLFEERVSRALQRLGMPTLAHIQALESRIAELEAQLAARSTGDSPAPRKSAAAKPPASKTAAKRPRQSKGA